jgi:hypothetical protein
MGEGRKRGLAWRYKWEVANERRVGKEIVGETKRESAWPKRVPGRAEEGNTTARMGMWCSLFLVVRFITQLCPRNSSPAPKMSRYAANHTAAWRRDAAKANWAEDKGRLTKRPCAIKESRAINDASSRIVNRPTMACSWPSAPAALVAPTHAIWPSGNAEACGSSESFPGSMLHVERNWNLLLHIVWDTVATHRLGYCGDASHGWLVSQGGGWWAMQESGVKSSVVVPGT